MMLSLSFRIHNTVERPNEEKNRWGQKKEKSTGVVEEKKPAPSNGTDSAAAEVVETAGASFGQEGGEEEMLMTEEQVDTFFQETIAKLTSLEEREKIKANVRKMIFFHNVSPPPPARARKFSDDYNIPIQACALKSEEKSVCT